MARHRYSVLDDAERPTVELIARRVAARSRPPMPCPRERLPQQPARGGSQNRRRVFLDGSPPLTIFRGDLPL